MINFVCNFLWFIRQSKKYLKESYIILVLKHHIIIEGIKFSTAQLIEDICIKKYGEEDYYNSIMNKSFEW